MEKTAAHDAVRATLLTHPSEPMTPRRTRKQIKAENVFKTHPLANKYGYIIGCVHSELDAFNKLPKKYKRDLRKLKLVNIRMNRFEQLRNSKPCKHCLPWCIEMFDEIWYTTDTGFELLPDNEKELYE